jgi:hypothetical protein
LYYVAVHGVVWYAFLRIRLGNPFFLLLLLHAVLQPSVVLLEPYVLLS